MAGSSERILVAMSGGVDSSVAAALLQRSGCEVIGVFLRNGVEAVPGRSHRQGCCGVDDAADARRVADRLNIPFYALDYEQGFEGLIDDFARAFAEGRTPNPCIECNRRFKMGSLRHLAKTLDAAAVATGHYATLVERAGGRLAVRRGRDRAKDQSYVLFSLGQDALQSTRLPLGDLEKSAVRALARDFSLPVAEKAESMEICFVPTGDYRDVVRARRPEAFEPGPIVTREGKVIGQHGGIAQFTIGQRKGLPGGQGDPLFVQAIDPEHRTVVVGRREQSGSTRFAIEELVFQGAQSLAVGAEIKGWMQVRAHHDAVPARVVRRNDVRAEVILEREENGIAPGQAAVLYDDDQAILMGGWIAREPAWPV